MEGHALLPAPTAGVKGHPTTIHPPRARLRDDPSRFGDAAGKEVAVKVAHPFVAQRICLDFHVLNGA
eukprot:gene1602-1410_t